VHETLYHFHKPKDEAEANLWLRRALVAYNNGDHRSEPHSRIEDWLKHLPANGVRAMCSWERFCTFAREPERRSVAGDATVSIEGASYEVEPELAGETVTLWWGLFDHSTKSCMSSSRASVSGLTSRREALSRFTAIENTRRAGPRSGSTQSCGSPTSSDCRALP
jgi:hypothetical protein